MKTAEAHNLPLTGRIETVTVRSLRIAKGIKAKKVRVTGRTYTETRHELKKWFNRYIREGGADCELHKAAAEMGIRLPFKCGGPLVCFHIIPVSRSRTLEFDERNVLRASSGDNQWEQMNRDKWMELWPRIFPEKKFLLDLAKMRKTTNRSQFQYLIGVYKELCND